MFLHFTILSFISMTSFMLMQDDPIQLIPVDAGFEDRGSLSDSLRVVPKDLRQNQSFEQLYKVAGSNDIYVRKAGGLSAVFKNPVYIDAESGSIPIVPAGTVYCIGAIRPELLRQLGHLYDEPPTPPTDPAHAPNQTEAEPSASTKSCTDAQHNPLS